MFSFLSTVFKIMLISLIVGVVLSAMDIDASDVLASVGLTPENIWIYGKQAIDWATPNIILGSLIVIPVWILIYLFRPPSS